jgi:hypothetical protein
MGWGELYTLYFHSGEDRLRPIRFEAEHLQHKRKQAHSFRIPASVRLDRVERKQLAHDFLSKGA